MDRPPTIWERLLVKFHQVICPPCGFMRNQLEDIRSACRWMPEDETDPSREADALPEAARARIKSALKDLSS